MEIVEEFREIEFKGTKLRVYKNGDIWRQLKGGCRQGELTAHFPSVTLGNSAKSDT